MADYVASCEVCGRIYNHTKLKKCPGCATEVANAPGVAATPAHTSAATVPSAAATTAAVIPSGLEADLLRAILEEARLTRRETEDSSRSLAGLASFLWISIMTSVLGTVFVVLASIFKPYDYDYNIGWMAVAGFVFLLGFAVALASLYDAAFPDDVRRRFNRAGR